MYSGTFMGRIIGNGYKIFVDISSNDPSVGLFSKLDGAVITDLIIVGTVIGLENSEYVGALAGTIQNSSISGCLNLANVTGISSISCVGGIAGKISTSFLEDCSNNGTIAGGQYVAGITGRFENMFSSNYLRNAGTIQSNDNKTSPSYIAGIIAYDSSISICTCNVNIGKIDGSSFDYVGGIVGYIYVTSLFFCSNSGVIISGHLYTGGIVGYHRGGVVNNCINTG